MARLAKLCQTQTVTVKKTSFSFQVDSRNTSYFDSLRNNESKSGARIFHLIIFSHDSATRKNIRSVGLSVGSSVCLSVGRLVRLSVGPLVRLSVGLSVSWFVLPFIRAVVLGEIFKKYNHDRPNSPNTYAHFPHCGWFECRRRNKQFALQ